MLHPNPTPGIFSPPGRYHPSTRQALVSLNTAFISSAVTAFATSPSQPDTKLKFAMLLQGGPEALKGIHINGLQGRVLERLRVHPTLRTGDTNRLAYVEMAQHWLNTLTPEDFKQQQIRDTLDVMQSHFKDVVAETEDLLLERGNCSLLTVETLVKELWEGRRDIPVMRLQINMTTANKVDKNRGLVGDAFKEKTLEWLRDKFGQANVFEDPLGTSFYIKLTSSNDAEGILRRFTDDLRRDIGSDKELIARLQKTMDARDLEGAMRSLFEFEPLQTSLILPLTTQLPLYRNLDPGKTPRPDASPFQLSKMVIKEVRAFLRKLAASTEWIDKNVQPTPETSVYDSNDLPDKGEIGFDVLQQMIDKGVGYTGSGVYGVAPRKDKNGDEEDITLVQHPRLRRLTGHLSHPKRPDENGGLLQSFQMVVGALLLHQSDDNFAQFRRMVSMDPSEDPELNGLGTVFHNTLSDIIGIGLVARRYARNPELLKPRSTRMNIYREKENSNFFIEEVVFRGYKHLAFFEVDNAKRRRDEYPNPEDETDSGFQRVRSLFFEVARSMEMVSTQHGTEVIMTPEQADLGVVAFQPNSKIDFREYLKRVAVRIQEEFSDQPINLEVKIQRPDGKIMRVPLWREISVSREPESTIKYKAQREEPANHKPVKGQQTITVCFMTLPDNPDPKDLLEGYPELVFRAGGHIDQELKYAGGVATLEDGKKVPLAKQGFAPLPQELIPNGLRRSPATGIA